MEKLPKHIFSTVWIMDKALLLIEIENHLLKIRKMDCLIFLCVIKSFLLHEVYVKVCTIP